MLHRSHRRATNCRARPVQGVRVGGDEAHEVINVEPNCIELQASDLSGAGLDHCAAGEQAEVLLMPRDALGNAGASLSGDEEGQLSLKVVVESADGTQTAAAMAPDVSKPGRLKVRRAGLRCRALCCRAFHVLLAKSAAELHAFCWVLAVKVR